MRPEERLAALLCRKHGYHDGDRTPCHLCWVEAAVLIAAGVSVPTESGAPDPRAERATALLDAVEEAIGSESLPGNIHHRLEAAYNAVVAEANR